MIAKQNGNILIFKDMHGPATPYRSQPGDLKETLFTPEKMGASNFQCFRTLWITFFFCCFSPLISVAQISDHTGRGADSDTAPNRKILEIRPTDSAYQKGFYDLTEYLCILPDTSGTFSIEEVSSEEWTSRFHAGLAHEIGVLQPAVDYYWVRLTTLSTLEQNEKWLIHLALPEVILFEAEQDGRFSRKVTGTTVPFSRRFFGDKYGHFAFLPLRLEAGRIQTRFLKVKAGEVLAMPYWKSTDRALLTSQFISRFEAKNRFSTALILGVFLAVALYHLILFAYSRRKSFLYFALFVFFNFNIAFYFDGFFLEYFFSEAPGFNNTFVFYLIVLGHAGFLILFSRAYLQLGRYVPRGDRWLKVLFAFQFLYCLMVLSLVSFQPDLYQRYSTTFFKLYALSMSLVFMFILVLSVICMRRRVPRAGIFVLAIGINLLQLYINVLHASAAISVPEYLVGDYGIALGLIVFAIGLGKQFKDTQEEKILAEALSKKQQEEAARLRELDKFKSRFYANITHEFRTPLTVIQGLAGQLQENPRRKVSEYTTLIKRNSRKLLHLINQMLDLSRLEAGKMEPEYIQGDIIQYLRYLIESFYSVGSDRQISVTFHAEIDQLIMDYDPEKCQQIIDNLVTNALKFTAEYSEVAIVAKAVREPEEAQQLEIAVSDTGIGIPKDKLPFIFDRFYQVDNSSVRKGEGAGLGLALVRELVELMGGSIQVHSKINRGTTFTFRLPVHNEAPMESPMQTDRPAVADRDAGAQSGIADSPQQTILKNNETPIVLLVEDNMDVISYLRSCLENQYRLLEARNGREGVAKARETIPDLVISDVMMPEMNGFELCRTLKTDERTNHIPVVLLTAKATQTDRVEGLSRGADAYLAKPFQKEELMVRLEQLLELRRKLQQKYQSVADGEAPEPEDPFLKKILGIIEVHLDDPDFTVERLSREVGMSRVQVHRKLKALTDSSASRHIRMLRMKKARELLKNPVLNISEVAYRVGYSDPAYFSRVFSKEFGVAPSEIRG